MAMIAWRGKNPEQAAATHSTAVQPAATIRHHALLNMPSTKEACPKTFTCEEIYKAGEASD